MDSKTYAMPYLNLTIGKKNFKISFANSWNFFKYCCHRLKLSTVYASNHLIEFLNIYYRFAVNSLLHMT
jgi:hypothetical protein